jgi:ribosomal protein L40E
MICQRCGAEVSESSQECSSCGTFAGYPNVRMAEKAEEVEALDARYFQALLDAEQRGALDKVEEFEAAVQTNS